MCNSDSYLIVVPSTPIVDHISSTSTSIIIVWSKEKGDFVKGFNVTAAYAGPCIDVYSETQIIDSSSTQYNLTDLQEYSNYTLAISAFNDNGSSLPQIIHTTTKPSGEW